MKIAFVGLGLIGGSIAKAIKMYHNDYTLIAYNRTKQSVLAALEDKTIDEYIDNIEDIPSDVDIVFLCLPIDLNIDNLSKLKSIVNDDCIITDVGSVKGSINKAAVSLGLNNIFIGGHPMAGSEKTGYSSSNARILENAYYILTPCMDPSDKKVTKLFELIKSIKALPIITDCDKHDYSTAGISHVPHLIAAALVNLIKYNDYNDEFMKMIAAGGFKDITRIASSSPVMWENICKNNPENIHILLEKYIEMLKDIDNTITNSDFSKVNELFEESSEYRNSINDITKGGISKSYKLYLNIADETGAIATIATMLASNGISIKNIGITHNRLHQEGVLCIIFYDDEAVNNARVVLENNGREIVG